MIRGLYTACSGMMAQMVRQDVLANNLANANTPGFKKDLAVTKAFPEILLKRLGEVDYKGSIPKAISPQTIGWMGTGVVIDEVATNFESGNIVGTENPNDFALTSEGYFCIETPEGIRYTRNGAFKIDASGRLVTTDGYSVMGKNGYINPGDSIKTDGQGNILLPDGTLEQFKIVKFEDNKQLQKIGNNLFQAKEGEETLVDSPGLAQAYLENSNVNAVVEMVELISAMRTYEMSQKVIQAEDQTLEMVANQVGKL